MQPSFENSPDLAEKRWPVSVGAIILAMMAIQVSSLGFSPLLPAISKEFHTSYSQIGLFTGLYGLVAIVMSVPAGLLAEKFGEKRMLFFGLCITACGLFGLAVAPSFGFALSSRVLWLVGYRVAFICVFTSIAVVTPARFRSRSIGILGSMAALASVIGAPLGNRVAESFGWRGGIRVYGVIALVGAALFFLIYRSPSLRNRTGGRMTAASTFSTLRNPVIWGLILLGLINMGGFSVTFFVPYAAQSVFHLTTRQAAAIISTSYIVSIVVNLAFGYLCDRYSRWTMMISLALVLIPASFAVMSHRLIVFEIAVALLISLGQSATAQIYGLGASVLGARDVGTAMGVVGLGSGVFGYLGPQMLGYLRDATGGFRAGWLFVACAAIISLVDLIVLRRLAGRAEAAGTEVVPA